MHLRRISSYIHSEVPSVPVLPHPHSRSHLHQERAEEKQSQQKAEKSRKPLHKIAHGEVQLITLLSPNTRRTKNITVL